MANITSATQDGARFTKTGEHPPPGLDCACHGIHFMITKNFA
jgi:hypothetical protein